ncbi:MAG: CDP-diacylglycerol--glycerol-3-phosphate 3-phosphatidyltransferase [Moraxellaceae bacterium]|nr:CDP-diacylglycerol--glycerol-3-phosphate 3-phosphatidyltransferase [Moraxellaceae bacterium]
MHDTALICVETPLSAGTLLNIPNALTLLRIVLIPVLVALPYASFESRYLVTAVVFLIAAITDWFDGYLARTLNQTSAFGRFLDPVADKLMVAAALIILVQWHASNVLMVISAIVIVSREITISALREWMAEIGKRASVAVSYIGKLKTTMQMTAITVLLVNDPMLDRLGFPLLVVAAGLTIWSMVVYLRAAWPDLKKS